MIELAEKLAADRRRIMHGTFCLSLSAARRWDCSDRSTLLRIWVSDPSNVNLMVNLDMVGRMKEGNGVQVGGVGTAAGLA